MIGEHWMRLSLFALAVALTSQTQAWGHRGNSFLDQIEAGKPQPRTFLTAPEGLGILREEIEDKESLLQCEFQWMALEPWLNAWYAHLSWISEHTKNATEPQHFNSAEKALNAHRALQLIYQSTFLKSGMIPNRLKPLSEAFDRFLELAPALIEAQVKRADGSADDLYPLLESLRNARAFDPKLAATAGLKLSDFFDHLLFVESIPDQLREAFFAKAELSDEALLLLKELHQRRLPLFLPDRIIARWNEETVSASEGRLYCKGWFVETHDSLSMGEHRARDFVALPRGWLAIDDSGKMVFDGLPSFWRDHLSPQLLEANLDWTGVQSPDNDILLLRDSNGRLFDHRFQQIGDFPKQAAAFRSHGYAWISRKGTLESKKVNEASPDARSFENGSQQADEGASGEEPFEDAEFQKWKQEMRNRFVRFQSIASSDDSLVAIDCDGTPHAFGFRQNQVVWLNGFRATSEYANINLDERVTWVRCFSGLYDFSIMEGPDFRFYVRFEQGGDYYMGVAGFQPKYELKVHPRNRLHLDRWPNYSTGVGYDKATKTRARERITAIQDFRLILDQCPGSHWPNAFHFTYETRAQEYGEMRLSRVTSVIIRPEVENWMDKFEERKEDLRQRRIADPNYGLGRLRE